MRDAGTGSSDGVPAIAFTGISKTYPNGTIALSDVSFVVSRGSIHAVCGENGAGKSTLMKILFGLLEPTEGQIRLDGDVVSAGSADFAGRHGIGMVHQHFSLIPTLTVTENIILGHEPRSGFLIDRAEARRQVMQLSEKYRLAVDPNAPTGRLSVAAQQKVEILKALARDTRILILDEPTAVLSPPEIEELFNRLRDLRDHGMTIIFISHKLNEVRALAESVTVLRGGRVTGTSRLADVPDDAIMQMVMGRAVEMARRTPAEATGAVTVAMEGVSTNARNPADRITDISLTIHAGEIVGIAGVEGSGQRGLVSVLSGAMKPASGKISFGGRDMAAAGALAWREAGLANLPADRFGQGGAPALTLAENAIAGTDGDAELQRGPFLRRAKIAERVRGMIADYSVKSFGIDERLDSLSGGNAQKLIAARELATLPKFLIADQPTRGIDVAAAAFLHRRLDEAAKTGCAILLVTADLDELLRLSDRVVVLFAGRVVADLRNGPELTPATLGPFMLGLERAA
jgi:simple sugar transport system ATP-binding protein